jgi:hypothetical protein
MKTTQYCSSCTAALAVVLFAAGPVTVSYAHNEHVHEELSRSAFFSSDGLTSFLSDNLGSNLAPFDRLPVLYMPPQTWDQQPNRWRPPLDWLMYGSYMEDMQDPAIGVGPFTEHFLRSSDHFYTLLRDADHSMLTDASETPIGLGLPAPLENSFRWATAPDVAGPEYVGISAGQNAYRWWDARDHQFGALTNGTQFDRAQELALMLFALGHVLHVNQDLSQPEHVRNDAHIPKRLGGHHAIEDYGRDTYLADANRSGARRAVLFPEVPVGNRGWPHWRDAGFTKLEDFWDRHKYAGFDATALNRDANGESGAQLGLAEFSNGNFLGEDRTH